MRSADPLVRSGRAMMALGAGTGGAVALMVGAIGWAVTGFATAVGAAVGAVLAVGVMAGGQACLVATSTKPGRSLLVALGAYVGGLAIVGAAVTLHAWWAPGVAVIWPAVGAAAGAYGYLGGAIVAHRRARIPLMTPAVAPGADPRDKGKEDESA